MGFDLSVVFFDPARPRLNLNDAPSYLIKKSISELENQ
jgi:hypothetical protein